VAALLLSLQIKRGQKLDTRAVKAAILASAIGCEQQPASDCRRILAGRLNVAGARAQIGQGRNKMPELAENSPTMTDKATNPEPSKVRAAMFESGSSGPASESGKSVIELSDTTESGGSLPADRLGTQAAVTPSECSCGRSGSTRSGNATPQLVYALGQLGYDYGTEARRDSILQHMGEGANPDDPNQLLSHLETNPSDAAAILWTLNLDATSIYVVQAQGPFASQVYTRLREFLKAQIDPEQRAERMSAPGYIAGSARLMNGQVVPVIWPELRGMFNWTTAALAGAVCGKQPSKEASGKEAESYHRKCEAVRNFLERVYHELRNLGTLPQERAVNFSATNAFNATRIFESALKDGLDLDTIAVERSPICRPESDCWDVKLTFFNPNKVFEQARRVYRFSVDVSDIVPVTVGPVRSWFVR
jgi:cyanobactin maturation PatA/PatG family protease